MKIGLSLNRSGGGPAVFMNNLKHAMAQIPGVRTSYFFDPFVSINIFANKPRLSILKPFIFRVDGVAFDKKMSSDIKMQTNLDLVHGISHARGVIYQSDFSQKISEVILGVKPQKSTIILNGTDLNFFNPHGDNIRKKLGIDNNAIIFVTSAKWRAHKRLSSIVSVFREVAKALPKEAYLVVIGEPDYKIEDDKRVISLGHVHHSELPAILRAGDIFLYFSWLDNCPNSVIEAIACGLPVICTNQGGTREIVEATSGGLVVEADNPFIFHEIALYEPPVPNISQLVVACKALIEDLSFYKTRIDPRAIDINNVAISYIEFIKQAIND